MLEIGCGIGVGAVNLARNYGVRVVATDISETMLDWARKRVAREAVADMVEFQQADVLELPFECDRFDAVISGQCWPLCPTSPGQWLRYAASSSPAATWA